MSTIEFNTLPLSTKPQIAVPPWGFFLHQSGVGFYVPLWQSHHPTLGSVFHVKQIYQIFGWWLVMFFTHPPPKKGGDINPEPPVHHIPQQKVARALAKVPWPGPGRGARCHPVRFHPGPGPRIAARWPGAGARCSWEKYGEDQTWTRVIQPKKTQIYSWFIMGMG